MKQLLVIFFVSLLTQSAMAQQKTWPSPAWRKQVVEVIKTSPAMKHVKTLTFVNTEKVKNNVWHDIVFETTPAFSKEGLMAGTFELVDSEGKESTISDTTLHVSVSDLSIPWTLPEGTDTGDEAFIVPTYEVGTMKIIKSYTAKSSKEEGGGSSDENPVSASADSTGAEKSAKVAYVEWVKEDSSFITTMNGKDYFFQLDSAGKWVSNDPDAPKAIKVGDRKKDPTFLFDKNGDLVASNKRNSYKFGMGDYAGYRNNYYRDALNGRPLGGGGYGPVASSFYPSYAPMYGGGWGGGYGGNNFGYSGCGFSAGLSLTFGWSSGCSYVNNNYCQPSYIGSTTSFVGTGNGGRVGINWLGSGVGWSPAVGYGGGYYDDGCGGCKSNFTSNNSSTETEEFYDIASAVEKSSPVPNNRSSEEETFYDLKSEDRMTKEIEPSLHMANSDLPPSRGNQEMNTVKEEVITSNNTSGDRKEPSTLPHFSGISSTHTATKPVKPAGNSNNEFASNLPTFRNISSTHGSGVKEPVVVDNSARRQGNGSTQSASNTKPGRVVSSSRVVNTTSRGNGNGQARVSSNRVQTKPNRNQGSMNTTSVYGNTKPSQRNSVNVNRGGGSKPQMQQRGSQRGGTPNVSVPQRIQQRSAKPMRPAPQQRQASQQKGQVNSGPKRR